MEKTDRQTDKAMYWIVTAYNGEIELLKNRESYPGFVKEVIGQDEICPTTGNKHFQGFVVLNTQQRMSALKKWLPTAHLEVCRNKDAVRNYCLKSDTRDPSGVQIQQTNSVQYIPFDRLCELLADTWLDQESNIIGIFKIYNVDATEDDILLLGDNEQWLRKEFKLLINFLIVNGYSRQAAAFADNRLKQFWIDTSRSWIRLRRLARA